MAIIKTVGMQNISDTVFYHIHEILACHMSKCIDRDLQEYHLDNLLTMSFSLGVYSNIVGMLLVLPLELG